MGPFLLTPERIARIKNVVRHRQHDLTVILENVHDPHNVGAVLRSCDSIGIKEIYVIYTDPKLQERGLPAGLKSSSGSRKWVKVHYSRDLDDVVVRIKARYKRILGTVMVPGSPSVYDIDWSQSVALAFGNERDGVSPDMQNHLDGNFIIPQAGFVQSLNISVACAVSLYEVFRQRHAGGLYNRPFGHHEEDESLYQEYVSTHNRVRSKGRMV